jgi:hypothetical protein
LGKTFERLKCLVRLVFCENTMLIAIQDAKSETKRIKNLEVFKQVLYSEAIYKISEAHGISLIAIIRIRNVNIKNVKSIELIDTGAPTS